MFDGYFSDLWSMAGLICMNQGVQGKCITNKAIPTRTTPFSKEKGAALGGTQTHDTLLSRQSALPTELPGQLSRQGSKSTTQGKVKPQYSVLWHRKPSLSHVSHECVVVHLCTQPDTDLRLKLFSVSGLHHWEQAQRCRMCIVQI